jgi:hypothetical protein
MASVDIKNLENLVDEINSSIDEVREKKIEVKDSDLPSNLSILLSGVSDSKAVNFLFSSNLDKILEKFFAMVSSGDIERLLQNEDQIKEIFRSIGLGEGSFKGPISKAIIKNIQTTTESMKFNKLKDNVKKVFMLIKNLESSAKDFKDKEIKKKYEETVHALKRVLRFAYVVYKNRSIINKKVISGLKNIVDESIEVDEPLISFDL